MLLKMIEIGNLFLVLVKLDKKKNRYHINLLMLYRKILSFF